MLFRNACLLMTILTLLVLAAGCTPEVADKEAAPVLTEVKPAPEPKSDSSANLSDEASAKSEASQATVEAEPKSDSSANLSDEASAKSEASQATTEAKPKPPVVKYKAEEATWIIDDFEGKKNPWRVEKWADPAEMSVAEGNLEIKIGEGKEKKATIGCSIALDLSSRKSFVLDVRNSTSKPVALAVAFMTGKPLTFFETERVKIKPGLKKNVTFNLKSDKFKSAGSNWEHKVKLANPDAAKNLYLLIYVEKKGKVSLDNIRFVK